MNEAIEEMRVLIVEDEAAIREITAAELREAGYEVVEAETGDKALSMLQQGEMPDVLFTDIRLPGKADGWTVAERFRAVSPTLPVLYATGYSVSQNPVEGSLFFRKPYRPSQVVWAIVALTGRRPEKSPE
jgi:CheY-like chemotaxis protein